MVKAYLRYEQSGSFGVINSNSNVVYDLDGKSLAAAALENVAIWNTKTGSQVRLLSPNVASTSDAASISPAPEVTQLARAPTDLQLAAGYSDGSVRLWDLGSGECTVTLKGHKSAVTALRYSASGALLASGSKDTDVVVWDVAAEAGLCRLRGHKDQVTDLVLVARGNRLVSCSKDNLVRVWDLDTQHCSQTLAVGKGEVWSLDVDPAETRLAVGASDAELRLFAIHDASDPQAGATSSGRQPALTPLGSVRLAGASRCAMVRFGARGSLLACLSGTKSVEVFRVRTQEEAAKKSKRRKKRRREKASHKAAKRVGGSGQGAGAAEDAEVADDDGAGGEEDAAAASGSSSSAGDELAPVVVVSTKAKVRSLVWAPAAAQLRKGAIGQLALGLSNNSVEFVDVRADGYDTAQVLAQGGHRSDVRSVALSPDDALLLSTSSNAVKLWTPTTGACLATMDSGYGLCSVFAPGGRHAVVGTKEGTLEVFDLGACTRSHVEAAHSGPVWSLVLLPDRSGFISASADKTVKFWTWAVAPAGQGSVGAGKVLSIKAVRSMEMADDVLSLAITPDGRLLAVALLDATIKVFYTDTLKFFLSLYGHKLPVTALAASSDGTLLASGSADKNIKVWGLDFGDCHKSLFAHDDAVMQVAWVPNTHYLFSTGKDRVLKYWDMDRHELLLELRGHHGEVWGLAVSAYGDFLVSGSHDRSLRRWVRTSEPFFVEEERERRLDSLFESDLEGERSAVAIGSLSAGGDAAAGQQQEVQAQAAPVGRKTMESVSAADAIVDAIDMATHAEEQALEWEAEAAAGGGRKSKPPRPPPSNPLMLGLTPGAFVLRAVAGVRAADLEQALLLLPFADALRLLGYLADWLRQGAQVELCVRTATLLLRLHHAQLMATPGARPALLELHRRLRPAVRALKDALGFNMAGLRHLQRAGREAAGVDEAQGAAQVRAALGIGTP